METTAPATMTENAAVGAARNQKSGLFRGIATALACTGGRFKGFLPPTLGLTLLEPR
jgi:hypothetical protein